MSFAEEIRRLRAKRAGREKKTKAQRDKARGSQATRRLGTAKVKKPRIGRRETPLRLPPPKKLTEVLTENLKKLWRRGSNGSAPRIPQYDVRARKYDAVEKVGRFTFAYNLSERVMYVWLKEKEPKKLGRWGFLRPLVEYSDIQEIHVRGAGVGVVHARFGYLEVCYVDFEVTDQLAAKLISNLGAYARAVVDFEHPCGYGELDGWRLHIKLDVVSGLPELVAARIIKIPYLTKWVKEHIATKILTLALLPIGIVIFGPPGSGKTTFLNSLLITIHKLFPWLRISVVETVPELRLPDSPIIHRTSPLIAEKKKKLSISEAVELAFRFERPNILVLGELRGDELKSWQGVARAGVPALTTVHSPNLRRCLSSLSSLLEAAGIPLKLTEHFKLFIEIARTETERGVLRYVRAVYFFADPDSEPVVIYNADSGVTISEEEFVELIRGMRSIMGDAVKLYERIKIKLSLIMEAETK